MTSHENRQCAAGTPRAEVEEILALEPGATAAEAAALAALFSAAAGPANSGELPGEAEAVAAFRAAHRPPVAGRPKLRGTLLTVKAAVAALAVTSVGGVALAATTGVLPTPLTTDSPSTERGAERSAGNDGADGVGETAPATLREAAKAAAAADRAAAKSDRSSSYSGLCTAFTAGAWDNARAAGNPAFSRLVAAAPDGNVAGFCAALADETPGVVNPSPAKGKSAEARGKNADKAVPAAPREKAAGNGPANSKSQEKPENTPGARIPVKPEKTKDTGSTDAARGAENAQRDQPFRKP